MKTLIIGPSWVGDMMMSQSLYRTLKQNNPDIEIDVMAPAWCRPLLSKMPEVNQALDMPLGHGALGLGERRKLGLQLKATHYQQAIVLPNSFKSALVPFFAGIPVRTGWRGEMRYGLLNDLRVLDKIAFPRMVERYVALAYNKAQIYSAQDIPQPILTPQLVVTTGETLQVKQDFNLPSERRIIGFCPGAEFGPAKRWPHYHYAELANQLIQQNYYVVLFGSAKDEAIGEDIKQCLPKQQRAFCLNLAGKTKLEQAISLINCCDAIVSNDSGLMHIAAALNKPLVALYGPTSPDFTPPLSEHARVIRLITGYHKIRKGDDQQGYHQSMIDISSESVMEQLNQLLVINKDH